MLTWTQRLKIRAAQSLLETAGLKVWCDLRVLHDSKKNLFGAQMAIGTLDELLPKLEARRVALRPDCRLELRLYATLVNKRGVFMGQEIPEPTPPGIVIGTAPPFDTWSRSRALRPRARAAGVVLEAKGEPPTDPPETDDALARAAGMEIEHGRIMSDAASTALAADLRNVQPIGCGLSQVSIDDDPHLLSTGARTGHDASGMMRKLEPNGPFVSTCSICGEPNVDNP